jgi:hypothetical protein
VVKALMRQTHTVVLESAGRSKRSRIIRGLWSLQYTLDSLRAPSAGKHYEGSGRVVTDGEGRLLGQSLLPF